MSMVWPSGADSNTTERPLVSSASMPHTATCWLSDLMACPLKLQVGESLELLMDALATSPSHPL